MADEFPTVGLGVDLSQIAAGVQAYKTLEDVLDKVGDAAEDAASKLTKIGTSGGINVVVQANAQAASSYEQRAQRSGRALDAEAQANTQAAAAVKRSVDDMQAALAGLTRFQQELVKNVNDQKISFQQLEAASKSLGLSQSDLASIAAALGTQTKQQADESKKAAEALAKQAAEAEKLKGQVDPMAKAYNSYSQIIEKATKLETAGVISKKEANKIAAEATKTYLEQAEKLKGVAEAGAGATREVVVLAREAARGDFSRMAGSASLLLQYLDLLPVVLNPVTLAFAGLSAALIFGASMFDAYKTEAAGMEQLANGVGATFGLTGEQIEEAAAHAAEATKIATTTAREMATAYARAGPTTQSVLQGLTEDTEAYAQATGVKMADAQRVLAMAIQDPTKFLEQLKGTLRGLIDGEQVEFVRSLQQQGDMLGAEKGALAILDHALEEHKQRVDEARGGWEKFGTAIVSALDRGLRGITSFFSTDMRVVASHYGNMFNPELNSVEDRANAAKQRQQSVFDQGQLNLGIDRANKLDYDGIFKQTELTNEATAAWNEYQAAVRKGSDEQYRLKTTWEALDYAARSFIPTQQKNNELADIDAKMAKARAERNQGDLQRLAERRKEIELSGTAITKEDAARQEAAAGQREQIASLARHTESIEANIRAMELDAGAALDTAAAYNSSSAAGDRAAAAQRALGQATRQRMSDSQRDRLIAAAENDEIAKSVAAGAKQTATLRDQTAAQADYMGAVERGTISLADAKEGLAIDNAMREREQQLLLATGKTREALIDELQRERAARLQAVEVRRQEQLLAEKEAQGDQIALLEYETKLIGMEETKRARLVAMMQEQLRLKRELGRDFNPVDPRQNALIQGAGNAAALQSDNAKATEAHNEALNHQLTIYQEIGKAVQQNAAEITSAFGTIGKAIGDVSVAMANYDTENEAINRREAEAIKKYGDLARTNADAQIALDDAKAKSATDRANNEQNRTLAEIDAVKGLFDQKSGAYKALQVIEAAYYAKDIAHTAGMIARAIARAIAYKGEAAAKAGASVPFPFNLAAIAATLAALAFIGGAFGGGGGSSVAPTSSDALQKSAGAGSVLGDNAAQSKSISDSLSLAEKYQDTMLTYTSEQVTHLKAIDTNIKALTTALANQLSVGGALDPSRLSLGTNSSTSLLGAIFGLGGLLFGKSTTTTSLYDQGLNLGSGTLNDYINQQVGASFYNVIQSTKKSSGFLGIGGGTKTTYSTQTSDASDLADEISRVLQSLKDGVLQAAGQLGVDGAKAVLDSFNISIGEISTKGLSASQISDELNAIFSKVGDQLAGAAAPQFQALQQAGEGMLQTLERLATEYTAVDDRLFAVGRAFGAVGESSVAARDALVQALGGLDTFTSKLDYYQRNFLTDAQRLAPEQQRVAEAISALGYSGVTTKAQFVDLVNSIDLTTTAGQTLFAKLMDIAPAFSDVADAADKAKTSADDLKRSLASTANDLVGQFLGSYSTITGHAGLDTQFSRATTLAGLDPSLQALQQLVYDAQDAAAAISADQQAVSQAESDLKAAYQSQAQTIQSTIASYTQLQTTLADFVTQLKTGDLNTSPTGRLSAAQAQFAALLGQNTTDALGKLPDAANTLLTLAKAQAPDSLTYRSIFQRTIGQLQDAEQTAVSQADIAQEQLETLKTQVSALVNIDDSTKTVAEAMTALTTAQQKLATDQKTGLTGLGAAMLSLQNIDAIGFGTLVQVLSNGNVVAKDPKWGAIQNIAVNQNLASALGFTGNFGGGGFDAWIASQSLAVRSQARDILVAAGQASRVDFSTADPFWGDYHNIAANMALAQATGYSGAFGGGQWQSWIVQQPEAIKQVARAILTQFNEADRIQFARGGIINRPLTIGEAGIAGEAGLESIMPLAQVGGKLGVHVVGADQSEVAVELRALRAEVKQSRRDRAAEALAMTKRLSAMDKRFKKWDGDGMPDSRGF